MLKSAAFLPSGKSRILVLGLLTALGALVMACGEEEEATLPIGQSTATPVDSSPSGEASHSATASPGTATTPGKAPEGCTASENAYVDPAGRFAFCYPVDMEISTVPAPEGPAVSVKHPFNDADGVQLQMGWQMDPWKLCQESPTIIRNQRIQMLVIDGQTVEACFQDHYDPERPDVLLTTSMDFRIVRPDGNEVLVLADYSGSSRDGISVFDILTRIFDSTTIE